MEPGSLSSSDSEASSDKPAFSPVRRENGASPNYKASAISPEAAEEVANTVASVEQRRAVREAIYQSASFSMPYVVMNVLATIVACYGLLSDSTAVVIGAMIIAMLLGPITGLGLALVDGDEELFRRSILAEMGGAALVLAISYLLGTLHREVPMTGEMLARTHPNLLDLMIALAGGAAGAYAVSAPRISVGLVGVAIATALVPPLTTCGLCLARGEFLYAWGGFLLFFTNLIAIQFATSAVLWLQGFHRVLVPPSIATLEKKQETKRATLIRHSVSITALLVLTATLGLNFTQTLSRQRFENEVRHLLSRGLQRFPGVALAEVRFSQRDRTQIVSAVVRSPFSFTPEQVRTIEVMLPIPDGASLELHIVSVIVKETTRDGYLHILEAQEQKAPDGKGGETGKAGTTPAPTGPPLVPLAPLVPLIPLTEPTPTPTPASDPQVAGDAASVGFPP